MERTIRLLEQGIADGRHIGGQLHLQVGSRQINFALGEARPGLPMTQQTLMLWLSTGKPLTAIAIALLYDRREVQLQDKVTRFIPEFGQYGKEPITLHHLLTHTGGFRRADKIDPATPWDQMIARICATPLELDWLPGQRAGYHMASSWFILGEIIQRISGCSFTDFMRAELFDPLGMDNTHFLLRPDDLESYRDRIGIMHSTASGQPRPLPLENPAGFSLPRPGSSARGPISEIGRFYRMLLEEGRAGSKQLLKPETVGLFTQPQRIGMYDFTFLHTLDFGLGFIVNSNRYGVGTVPYGYGEHASDSAFGHSGAESSCAFADPRHDLVVAWVLNGMCGDRAHNLRAREINSALYEDAGLS